MCIASSHLPHSSQNPRLQAGVLRCFIVIVLFKAVTISQCFVEREIVFITQELWPQPGDLYSFYDVSPDSLPWASTTQGLSVLG